MTAPHFRTAMDEQFQAAPANAPLNFGLFAQPPELRDGEPCAHPGCLSHFSHPCEGCGRVAGIRGKAPACPRDTDGDGNCGRPGCPHCGERAQRDQALEGHEARHAALLAQMRQHARSLHLRTNQPVSANDVRHLLDEAEPGTDRRVLGQVFAGKEWKRVGSVETSCQGATQSRVGAARSLIGTYILANPTEG